MNLKIATLLVFFAISVSGIAQTTSPYTTSWGTDGWIIGGGFVNGFVASEIDGTVTAVTPAEISALNKNDINAFDRWATNNYSVKISKTSDYLAVFAIVAPAAFFANDRIGKDWEKVSFMYMETMLWSAMLPSYAKGTVKRLRPYSYNSSASESISSDTRKSFFSGHTCVAFSSAVFLSKVFSDYNPDSKYIPYICGGSLLLAGTVGFLRIESGMHFPTDVLVGAVVGSAVGYIIPALHKKGTTNDGISMGIQPLGFSINYVF